MRREWRKPVDKFFTQLLRPSADSGTLEERLEDWGFNYPRSYVLATFKIWFRSDYKIYPQHGSWNDQDPQWCEDMSTCLDILEYHKQRLEEPSVEGLPRLKDLT